MLQIINFCLENVILLKISSVMMLSVIVMGLVSSDLYSQSSSPASWLYPDGNWQSPRCVSHKSDPLMIESFSVKWSTPPSEYRNISFIYTKITIKLLLNEENT
ncbi:MAG: hypothetical protein CVV22_06400 [Ignavibacteriae bacterium HGW-Ignavibacteriae-1]|nr:MAG: hypothetical protein CVV22_06400 [Ignavibacteriae bacterium HGW-Ignavibacteriae-1]